MLWVDSITLEVFVLTENISLHVRKKKRILLSQHNGLLLSQPCCQVYHFVNTHTFEKKTDYTGPLLVLCIITLCGVGLHQKED